MKITTVFYTIFALNVLTFWIIRDKIAQEVLIMRIKGTSNTGCNLCSYAHTDKETDALVCMYKNEKTAPDGSCKKFDYDIYKYTPKKKADFSKFSKEDFEI